MPYILIGFTAILGGVVFSATAFHHEIAWKLLYFLTIGMAYVAGWVEGNSDN